MLVKQPARSITTRRGKHSARRRAGTRTRRARRREKRTFYRYRRGGALALRRLALVLVALALAWWAGVSLHRGRHLTPALHAGRLQGPPHTPSTPTPPPTTTPSPPLTLDGGPSLSASQVDGILAAYDSPLHGQGKTIVELSRRYGIDDAVALAFFVMESRAGTQGEAVITHSFGNLRPMPGAPAIDGYRAYRTWREGATEWFSVLRTLYLDTMKLRTVEAVVPVYAPSSDSNDPPAMIAGIHQLVRCWRGDVAACPDDPPSVRALVAGALH